MTSTRTTIEQNLGRILSDIESTAGRSGREKDAVRLVAVTKAADLESIRILYDLGLREFAENRLHAAKDKIPVLPDDITWHMIGNVQRRKALDVVRLFNTVDSVDRVELAEALQKRCVEMGREAPLEILLEVNVSGEESKHGFAPETLPRALETISQMDCLTVHGLLTMAPYVQNPEETRPFFAQLRELAQEFGLPELSMGMSNDYRIAVEEGATQVRIGSALFRETN